jgi:hypothetical protein
MDLPKPLEKIIKLQIHEIEEELEIIDKRLSELKGSEEDKVEAILLESARRFLLEDLKTLTRLTSYDKKDLFLVIPTISLTIAET